jgi:hypothetical protein
MLPNEPHGGGLAFTTQQTAKWDLDLFVKRSEELNGLQCQIMASIAILVCLGQPDETAFSRV